MLRAVADGIAKDVKDDLANDEEKDTKGDIAQRPSVIECTKNEQDLTRRIYEETYGVHNVRDDEDANGVLRVHSSPALESKERDGAAYDEHGERRQSQQPYRKSCAILIELEADKAVYEQTCAQGRGKPVLRSSEVRECG